MSAIDSVRCSPSSGEPIEVEVTMETAPAVLFDALVLPSGKTAIDALGKKRPGNGIHKTSIPPLQADSRA